MTVFFEAFIFFGAGAIFGAMLVIYGIISDDEFIATEDDYES